MGPIPLAGASPIGCGTICSGSDALRWASPWHVGHGLALTTGPFVHDRGKRRSKSLRDMAPVITGAIEQLPIASLTLDGECWRAAVMAAAKQGPKATIGNHIAAGESDTAVLLPFDPSKGVHMLPTRRRPKTLGV